MNQKIYLSRHGQILRFVLSGIIEKEVPDVVTVPELEELLEPTKLDLNDLQKITRDKYQSSINVDGITGVGRMQSRFLGRYLKSAINDNEDVVFVTSNLERSIDSARTVSIVMERPLNESNHYCTAKLQENVSREYLQWLGKYARNFPSMVEIGSDCYQQFIEIGEKHPDKTVVAVLHQCLNQALLQYLADDFQIPSTWSMDNGGLYTLERNRANISLVNGYRSNEYLAAKK